MFEYIDPNGNALPETEVIKLAEDEGTRPGDYITKNKLKKRSVKAKTADPVVQENPFGEIKGADALGINKFNEPKVVSEKPKPIGLWVCTSLTPYLRITSLMPLGGDAV